MVVAGGIGAGKSEAGRMLAERGFAVMDSDRAGHEVLAAGHPVSEQVAARWPEAVVDGRIDRRRLGRIVFGDPRQLAELESLTHPAIAAAIERWSIAVGDRPAAVEIPVGADLVGAGWTRVVVDVPTESRRERLRGRGMSDSDIDARIAVQPSRAEWRSTADIVVDNSGTRDSLRAGLGRVLAHLMEHPPASS